MQKTDYQIFASLKEEVAQKMVQAFPRMNPVISEWKGQEIVNFQEELLQKVNAHISEKWFYIHFKSGKETLPRTDMLNLLSIYAGYASWDAYRYRNKGGEPLAVMNRKVNRWFIYIPALVITIFGIFFLAVKLFSSKEYIFRFYDADTREPIVNSIIEVSVLRDGESPVSYLCRPDGSFRLKTGMASICFAVRTPYYLTDTITRTLNKFERSESVQLTPNNYALMLHYFSQMNVKDWQRRRSQLDRLISDSAMIYQLFDNEAAGLELYNKWEFINKLTLPSKSLKDIEILDTRYAGSKITLIRFRQKSVKK